MMVDLFAHPDSRAAFISETEQLAAREDSDDAVVALRKLVAEEPLAILFCVDGSYVKASPSILKTTSLYDDTTASLKMRKLVQTTYKDHLARNKGDDVKSKHFGAAEVRSRLGACVGSLVTCFSWQAYVSFLLILLTVTLINRLRMQVVASALSNHPSGPAFTGACGTVTPGVPTWLVHGLGCG